MKASEARQITDRCESQDIGRIIKILERDGYTVKREYGDQRDPYDILKISW